MPTPIRNSFTNLLQGSTLQRSNKHSQRAQLRNRSLRILNTILRKYQNNRRKSQAHNNRTDRLHSLVSSIKLRTKNLRIITHDVKMSRRHHIRTFRDTDSQISRDIQRHHRRRRRRSRRKRYTNRRARPRFKPSRLSRNRVRLHPQVHSNVSKPAIRMIRIAGGGLLRLLVIDGLECKLSYTHSDQP